jgi:hypothetical protein
MRAHLSVLLFTFGLAVIFGISSLVIAFTAASYSSKHSQGPKVSFWDVRFHPLKYLKQYRELTIEENGKSGGLFYAWFIAFGLFAVCIISLISIVLIG